MHCRCDGCVPKIRAAVNKLTLRCEGIQSLDQSALDTKGELALVATADPERPRGRASTSSSPSPQRPTAAAAAGRRRTPPSRLRLRPRPRRCCSPPVCNSSSSTAVPGTRSSRVGTARRQSRTWLPTPPPRGARTHTTASMTPTAADGSGTERPAESRAADGAFEVRVLSDRRRAEQRMELLRCVVCQW
uniref:HMA domain-containing protein n=1 Tax=Zea mays TaxID=4577 RepID=B4FRK9_MAIZE|nr:unknown [Zea mays]|eukprot:NP_001140830.1 uncharacterized protein LOC100275511 [Zea mays]